MKHHETVTETRTFAKVVKTTCDCCGLPLNHDRRSSYNVGEVTIEARDGDWYPESGFSGETYEADVCMTCFREKVVPALQALGINVAWKDH